MDGPTLQAALISHSQALANIGARVSEPAVGPPARPEELDAVETALGQELPTSFRRGLETLARSVDWSWDFGEPRFPSPFDQLWAGELRWSIDTVVEEHQNYLGWVHECFPDPHGRYDAPWHDNIGFSSVGNGDVLALDASPDRPGAIVYLSHDAGDGHGYLMAHSLADLLDRWVPIACPGPEDVQWLPFVPYDLGPIDPACADALRWRELLGLSAAPAITSPSEPDDELFDELMRVYRREPGTAEGWWAAFRAMTVCSTDRASGIIDLLEAEDQWLQEAAACRLGIWRWEPAVPPLTRVAVEGTHNGRMAAMTALLRIPGHEADAAIEQLRNILGREWPIHRSRT